MDTTKVKIESTFPPLTSGEMKLNVESYVRRHCYPALVGIIREFMEDSVPQDTIDRIINDLVIEIGNPERPEHPAFRGNNVIQGCAVTVTPRLSNRSPIFDMVLSNFYMRVWIPGVSPSKGRNEL